MVVEILVAQRDADDALHHQGLNLVLDQPGGACVGEACGEVLGQPDGTIGLHPAAGRRHPK
jgi:hypothetical protein